MPRCVVAPAARPTATTKPRRRPGVRTRACGGHPNIGLAPRNKYAGPVLTTVTAGPYTIRGVSVGGVYTSLAVPELSLVFDAGISPRSAGGIDTILLSHGHVDHIGALPALLGIRALQGKTKPPRVVMPAEIVDDLRAALAALSNLQRWPLDIDAIGMLPGDDIELRGDISVRPV